MSRILSVLLLGLVLLAPPTATAADVGLLEVLQADDAPQLIGFTPSQLDPRNANNNVTLKTSSLQADLAAIRPVFDGIVLYGYHEACTPRILHLAKQLKFRVVLLAIWNPKSAEELDGVAQLARQYEEDFALGVIVGNEGIHFGRYELEDLAFAAARLRERLPAGIPLTTSEPYVQYQKEAVREFGDFLCPNIHPVFDRKEARPEEAAAWARDAALKLAEQTGKPVVLKETGFPHGGQAKFSEASQRAFWNAYVQPGLMRRGDRGWAYYGVAFEAFDLPWKAEASGLPIERSWGLFSPERRPYPALNVWKAARE